MQKNKNPGIGLKTYLEIATVLISVATLYYGVCQFIYSENIIDRRKYFNAFYDERYNTLKEITKSISEITTLISYHDGREFTPEQKSEIAKKVVVFNYSHLVLDHRVKSDSVVLNYINAYEILVDGLLQGSAGSTPSELSAAGEDAIKECAKILNYEKDTINSFNFKLLPF